MVGLLTQANPFVVSRITNEKRDVSAPVVAGQLSAAFPTSIRYASSGFGDCPGKKCRSIAAG